jgi:hypothetical protein
MPAQAQWLRIWKARVIRAWHSGPSRSPDHRTIPSATVFDTSVDAAGLALDVATG